MPRHLKLSVLLCLVSSTPAMALSVQLGAGADATLYQDPAGALASGQGTGLFAGTTSQTSNAIRRGLVRFDVTSAVPAGSTITSATLILNQSAANTTDRTVSLHHVLASWGEGASNASAGGGGGGAPAQPGDATWIHRSFNSDLWTNVGGDFNGSPLASAVVGGPGLYAWSGAAFTAEVQAILDGSVSNFGWLLLGVEGVSGSSKRFSTREESSASLRPVLAIEYTPVPTPASAAPALLSALLVMRRRRPER